LWRVSAGLPGRGGRGHRRHAAHEHLVAWLRAKGHVHGEQQGHARHGGTTREHRHLRAQLLYAARGIMTVVTEAGTWTVPPHQAVWIPPEVGHEVRMPCEVSMRSLYIAPIETSFRLPHPDPPSSRGEGRVRPIGPCGTVMHGYLAVLNKGITNEICPWRRAGGDRW